MKTIIDFLTEREKPADAQAQPAPQPAQPKGPAYHKPAVTRLGAAAYKGGRCWNGAHRDAGLIYHWVPEMRPDGFATHHRALCGAQPGRRSYGWSLSHLSAPQPVTCPLCLKKLAKAKAKEARHA